MKIKCIFLIINHNIKKTKNKTKNHNITVGKFEATEGSHRPDELTDQNGPHEASPASLLSLTQMEQLVLLK